MARNIGWPQPQKTLDYAKALQHWPEKAQLPMPGKPHQLAETMLKALTSYGTSNLIHRCTGSGQQPGLQLGQNYIIQDGGAHLK